jgi:hypothetical protein
VCRRSSGSGLQATLRDVGGYSEDGDRTEREISRLKARDEVTFDAFCHLRDAERTFVFYNVERAIRLSTGEVLHDLRPLVGIAPLPARPAGYLARAARKAFAGTQAEKAALRKKQRRELKAHYRLDPVWDLYKARLHASFGDHCFRCGAARSLNMTPYVPLAWGGALVPGNIHVLCPKCLAAKGDQQPEDFYSAEEISRLEPILAGQVGLMSFQWTWKRWNTSRHEQEVYVRELGVPDEIVTKMFHDPTYLDYVPDSD